MARWRQLHSFPAWLAWLSVAIPFLAWVGFSALRFHHHLDREERYAAYSADIVAEQLNRSFKSYALLSDLVAASFEDWDGAGVAAYGHAVLRSQSERMDESVHSIFVTDRSGTILASSHVERPMDNVGDRPFFREAAGTRGHHVGGMFIAQQRVFSVSRRIALSDGPGVAVVVVRSEHYERFFSAVAAPDLSGMVLAVFRMDGRQILRWPGLERPVRLDPDQPLFQRARISRIGQYRMTSVVDGIDRHYAYSRIDPFDAVVSVGIDHARVLRSWGMEAASTGILALGIAAALSLLIALARARARALQEANLGLEQMVGERTAQARDMAEEAVSARRLAESALVEKEAALGLAERANQAKSHFIAAASHDLRQPLQALSLYLEVLGTARNEADRTLSLDMAKRALGSAMDLLSTLMDLSALEAGLTRVDVARVEIHNLLLDLDNQLRPVAVQKGLRLKIRPCRHELVTDRVLLERALRNIVANAIKYTDRGGVLVACRMRGGAVRIEIYDTGAGIPADRLETIFEDFTQLRDSTREMGGLGIGLSVTRRIAHLLGFRVEVRSRLGQGSRFALVFAEPPRQPGAAGQE